MDQRELWIIGLLILIASISTSLMFVNNHINYSFDDLSYLQYSFQQYYGKFNPLQSPFAFGYLLPLPIALSFYIFGFSLFAASLPFMLMYVLLIIVIYLTCRKLFNQLISFSTALICSFSAFIVAYSPRLLPDIPIGLAVALALYCLLDKNEIASISAGIFMGLIFYIKVGAAFMIPIALISLLLAGAKKKALYFLIGALVISLIYFAFLGFNFNIIKIYSQGQVTNRNQTDLASNLYEGAFIMPFGYWFYGSRASIQIFPLGLLFLLGLAGGLLSWYKKNMKILFAFLLFIGTYLYLFLGTEGIRSYVSITVEARYIIWFSSCIALCAAYCINWIYVYVEKRWNRDYAVTTLMCLITLAFISNLPSLLILGLHSFNFIGAPIAS